MNFSVFIKTINDHKIITLFHHQYPDFDALGSKYGIYHWLKCNFPDKIVFCLGTNTQKKFKRLFPETSSPTEEEMKESFAIVCDVDGTDRVDDQRFKKANKVLVIDHHLRGNTKGYSDYRIVDIEASSTAEIVTLIFLKKLNMYTLPYIAMECLFLGIVTDTGRFLYPNTTMNTYKILEKFKKLKLSESKIYNELYVDNLKNIQLKSYITNNFTLTRKGVGYFLLTAETINKFGIRYSEAKEYVYAMAGISEASIWFLITIDPVSKLHKISLRSRHVAVNEIAMKYSGGGHKLASGCSLKTIEELPKLIKDLESLI